jgi:hypothetical protein
MATDEPVSLTRLVPPRRLGRLLSGLREARGDSPEAVALRAWGQLDADRLRQLEAGEIFATPEELTLLSKLYAFEVRDLVPQRMDLVIDFQERLLVTAGFAAVVPYGETIQQVLRRYLTLVWALRGKPAGSQLQLRELDVEVLGEGLGTGRAGTLGVLHELMEDPTWVAQRGHPSMLATILPVKVAPAAGILLTAGAEAGLVFQAPDDPTTPTEG